MKKSIIPAVVALAVTGGSAFAADISKPVYKAMPVPAVTPAWDIAIGGVVMTDYNFRGVSQSNRGPSAGAYFESQYNGSFGTLYAGLAGYGINWASGFGFTDPSAEIDLYGGWRNTWGALSLDLGAIYYYYPKEIWNGFTKDSDFIEFYAKVAYAVTPDLTVGGNFFYTPDLLNYSTTFATAAAAGVGVTGDADAIYASATLKWVTPWKTGDFGAYISGEFGHWWINDTPFVAAGGVDPSYTYYNAGIAFTYKAITLDLRYHGTDQSVAECASFLVTAVGNQSNKWCDEAVIASLKFDTSLNALK